MNLTDLPAILLKRWPFTLVGLVVTLIACGLSPVIAPAEYQFTTNVLIVPPRRQDQPQSNPYAGMGGLFAPADVLAKAMSTDETVDRLRSSGASADFEVSRDPSTSAPVIVVTSSDRDEATARRTNEVVAEAVPGVLEKLQSDVAVPPEAQLTAYRFAGDLEPTRVYRKLIRLLVVAAGAGLALTVFGTVLLDGFLTRRKRGAPARAGSSAVQPAAGTQMRASPANASRLPGVARATEHRPVMAAAVRAEPDSVPATDDAPR